MHKKKLFKLALVSAVLCVMFCGCGKDNSDNKKTADNIASSTDVTIDNTDIASADSSEISENTSTTTEANTTNSASGGIETESSNAINDDDTNNNENRPNNGGNNGNVTTQTSNGNGGNTPSTTEQPSKPENTTTEDTKPQTPTTTEEVTDNRYIEPVYETKTVCVQEAYDEPIYETHSFCNGCGTDLTVLFPDGHYSTHIGKCQGGSSYHPDKVLVNTIHHDAVYETKEVLVSGGYDEVISKIVCDDCGAVLYSSN